MARLRILICGAGCAGPALAYWLVCSGHDVVVCERSATLRAAGAQIDLRAQGIQVVKRMGLIDVIRSKLVDEEGISFVDSQGNPKATLLANKSGEGAQSLTSEFEIMRGDLVRIFYDATKDGVAYVFDKTVERFDQDENKVFVHFSDNSSDTFDLLVGADGQGSRIRKAMLPPDSPDPYCRFGVHAAYWFVPRIETDTSIGSTYHIPGGRMISRRSHNATETQVYFILRDDSEDLRSIPKASIEQQKDFWTHRFRDVGWQVDRFLEGMKTTDNFYCQEVVQVRTPTWYKGRVVLLGDAAHCPAAFTGMGTTSGLVGAYVLAGEINRDTEDLPRALERYDEKLRPFVDEMQKVNPFFLAFFLPKTQLGITIFHFVVGLLCFLRIPALVARFSGEEKGGWNLPDYTERGAQHEDKAS